MKSLKVLWILAFFLCSGSFYALEFSPKIVQQETEDEIVIQGAGVERTLTMNGGTLRIQGASSKIKVEGFVDKIIIQGAGVEVDADVVNFVQIQGASTKVRYKSSKNKNGIAKANISGAGSGIIKLKR